MNESESIFPYSDHMGIIHIHSDDGKSHFQLDVQPFHFNPQQVVHGGVLYGLADTAMGAALYQTLDHSLGELCATIELKMSFVKAVRSGHIDCYTEIIRRGKRVAFLESKLYRNEQLVAIATGSFSIFIPSKI